MASLEHCRQAWAEVEVELVVMAEGGWEVEGGNMLGRSPKLQKRSIDSSTALPMHLVSTTASLPPPTLSSVGDWG